VAYDHQIAVIHSATAQLTALGAQPRVIAEEDGAVRIEAEVTAVLIRHWPRLIEVLYLGADFGLTDTDTGQIAWLRIESGESARP
jgi:hypothetical protein